MYSLLYNKSFSWREIYLFGRGKPRRWSIWTDSSWAALSWKGRDPCETETGLCPTESSWLGWTWSRYNYSNPIASVIMMPLDPSFFPRLYTLFFPPSRLRLIMFSHWNFFFLQYTYNNTSLILLRIALWLPNFAFTQKRDCGPILYWVSSNI